MKNKNKAKLAALALVPVLGAAAFAGSAFAADGSSASSTGTTSSWKGKIMSNFHRNKNRDNTQFANDLASVLGLSATDVKAKLDAGQTPQSIITGSGKNVTDVQAALKAIRLNNLKTKLAAEVSAGKLTQAQADAIIARESNETNNGSHMRRMGHKFFGHTQTTNTTTGSSTQ